MLSIALSLQTIHARFAVSIRKWLIQLNRIHTVERSHLIIYVEIVERTHLLIYAEIVERAYLIIYAGIVERAYLIIYAGIVERAYLIIQWAGIYAGIVERAYLIIQWAGISGYNVISDMTSLAASLWTLDGGGGVTYWNYST